MCCYLLQVPVDAAVAKTKKSVIRAAAGVPDRGARTPVRGAACRRGPRRDGPVHLRGGLNGVYMGLFLLLNM